MTPADFRAIRTTLGQSAEGMARLLGVASGRTIRKWEHGDRDIPGPAKRLMWLLRDGRVSVRQLAKFPV